MQNLNEDHQDIVKVFQDALKDELKHCISKKKYDLEIFDKYIEKNKTDAAFKKFVKKNILLSIQLSFLLFETSVAALNITKIIEECFLSNTENEKGVLSKEYILEVYPEQSETLKIIQSSYDVYNLSGFYFLFKCGYLYYDDDMDFSKIEK
ncbi:hypothetical protein GVAV_002777 [Gurleya vavrai]